MNTIINDIEVIKAKTSKINDVDFNNLKFGSVFSDHMLECNFKDGKWQAPKVLPYQPIVLDPSSKPFSFFVETLSHFVINCISIFVLF